MYANICNNTNNNLKNITMKKIIICFSFFFSFTAVNCNLVFKSDVAKNGTFSSPSYPNPYPSGSFCRYEFEGRGKERVQIVFTDFNLYHPNDDSKE